MSSSQIPDILTHSPNEFVVYNGRRYSVEMTWKYLEFLQTHMREHFGCVAEFKTRNLEALEALFKRIEATTSIHRSQIFAQIANASSRDQFLTSSKDYHQPSNLVQQGSSQQQVIQEQSRLPVSSVSIS